MTPVKKQSDAAVDVVFPLEGQYLPRDHAQALRQALCRLLPWLDTEAQAGIHPIKLVPGADSPALLSKRSLLLLRVAPWRVPDLGALAGLELMVAGHRLRLGVAHRRELQAHSALYACQVAADSEDEVSFMATLQTALADLGVGGECVCGKHHELALAGGMLNTFSLMLHALPPEQSLRLQQYGVGPHRLLGCGVFVPHKSAAVV